MFEPTVYEGRRRALASALRDRGMRGRALFLSNGESPRNYPGNCYPFRQDSNWLYFFGLGEPDMAALIEIEDGGAILFGDDITMDDMIWTGPRPSVAERARASGVDLARSLAALPGMLAGAPADELFFPPYAREESVRTLSGMLDIAADEVRRRAGRGLTPAIVALREIKEPREIAEMERAAAVSVDMHQALLRELRPGWTELEAAALVEYVAAKNGCALSFSTIGTTHGEVLHNHGTELPCREGELFLLDAGAEVPSGYAGDLTTTFPVGGRFSPRQADIYRVLREMFAEATKALRPGLPFVEAHLAASRALACGLKDLGVMRGDPDAAVAAGAHALFFPHGLGHMIGLDVHDMEGLGEDNVGYAGTPRSAQFGLSALRLAKPLVPGMVHSVEPGIYFIPGLIDQWKAEGLHREFIDYGALEAWRGCGGMRIEEDWLATPDGARRLGPALDKSIEAIELARGNL
ncbi:Xaa-Pro aminopeptidase [bacterium]|nr:Xaa-Pro aminopeptidase [bacterium]